MVCVAQICRETDSWRSDPRQFGEGKLDPWQIQGVSLPIYQDPWELGA